MLGAHSRILALICLSSSALTYAQSDDTALSASGFDAGDLYEQSRQDVTLPVASETTSNGDETAAVIVPLENQVTPMRCMTAWSYLAGRAIERPDATREMHPDFTEATATAHWQHWLKRDLDANQGTVSTDFHQRRLAAERAFSLALARHEEPHVYRTLGACYVAPLERTLGDPTVLLRNFMIEHQGLPERYAVPVLQRQLRAFPISESIDAPAESNCDAAAQDLAEQARAKAIISCVNRGGVLVSQIKLELDATEELCRATATVQCENIP